MSDKTGRYYGLVPDFTPREVDMKTPPAPNLLDNEKRKNKMLRERITELEEDLRHFGRRLSEQKEKTREAINHAEQAEAKGRKAGLLEAAEIAEENCQEEECGGLVAHLIRKAAEGESHEEI